jgi:ABC-type transport system involved in multi-copper enzyme maturation permease subunit
MQPLFAALTLEREAYTLGDIPGLAQAWFQDAGGFLLIGALVYLLVSMSRPHAVPQEDGQKKGGNLFLLLCTGMALLCFSAYGAINLYNSLQPVPTSFGADPLNYKPLPDPTGYTKIVNPKFSLFGYEVRDVPKYVFRPQGITDDTKVYPWQSLALTLAGVFSFLAICTPLYFGVRKLKFQRIWAITTLSIKEVIRNRIIILFVLLLMVLLVPLKWFNPSAKAEDELIMDITLMSGFIAPVLMLVTCALLAAFALPLDVKRQNIFTITTKPVEKFEIVLGRFLGYALLFTVLVFSMSCITLATLLASNPSEAAKQKTVKARVPHRGTLTYESRRGNSDGIDVGREFNYRKYIGGDPRSSQRAVYSFKTVPSGLGSAKDDAVPVEFSFDIYRLTKGEENRGVDINVRVVSWQAGMTPPGPNDAAGDWKWADTALEKAYRAEALAEIQKIPVYKQIDKEEAAISILRSAAPGSKEATRDSVWAVANKLAEKYGFFEFVGKQIYDFKTESLNVPSGLFRNGLKDKNTAGTRDYVPGKNAPPRVIVYIHCTSSSQMLGMAEGDLYLLQTEQGFAQNYIKSAFGVWCWLMIVLGLAITLSTYLDSVVTLLAVLFFFLGGMFSGFINELAMSSGNDGPMTAVYQLSQAKQPTAQNEGTTIENVATKGDAAYRWVFRRIVSVLPDIQSFSWTSYVAEGFNIPLEAMFVNLLVVMAYLFPWFGLAYYLIRGREMAA